MPSFPARVAAAAGEVRLVRVVLTILALPFYLLGLLVGLLVVAVSWSVAAVKVGVDDVRTRSSRDGEAD